ncbi:MAG: glycerate kinase [Candidatus Heimdallarchaeota archaeon]
MYIKNTFEILTEEIPKDQFKLRKIGLQAISKAISAVKPENLMEKSIKVLDNKLIIDNDEYYLPKFEKIHIIGGGKATAEMALTLERILSNMKDIDYSGIINVPEDLEQQKFSKKSKISINFASHPIPNENGLKGTLSMVEMIENSTKNDLFICLISGGGSALLPLPKKGILLKDIKDVNSLLLSSGASIHEINTIRKHLSDFKGGNLAKKIYSSSGAILISLIISDVVGDDLDSIASGPTVPDKTTFKDALEIIKKYNLLTKIPISVNEYLEKGLSDRTLETPKPNDSCFINVHNYLIGSVIYAAQEVKSFLTNEGFEVNYFSAKIIGEAKEFGKSLFKIITTHVQNNLDQKISGRKALIGTGELTVTIRGKGIGGRNQEMLLSFLDIIKDKKFDYNFLIIGANLDGIEGNSKAMGALIDNYVLSKMISNNLNPEGYLFNNDSNSFFKTLRTEIVSGPTGCNVNDLIVILISI